MSNAIAITQDPIDIDIIKSNMKATTIPEIYIVNISYSHLDVFE